MNTAKRNRDPGSECCVNSDLGIPGPWWTSQNAGEPLDARGAPGEVTELGMFNYKLGFFTGTCHSQTWWTEGNQAQSGAGRSARSPRLVCRGGRLSVRHLVSM